MVDIHGLSNVPPPQPNPGSNLSDQLETLIQAFKSNPNDPATIHNLLDFLMRNQSFIERACINNGWNNNADAPAGANYSAFIEGAESMLIEAQQYVKQNPDKPLPPRLYDFILELSTQIHWLLTNKSPIN
jgi:hypothetical protein